MSESHGRAATFDGLTCSAPEPRALRMAEIVRQYAPADRSIRLLDLGCGTGPLVFRAAQALPRAECVGVDISSVNIAAAEAARRQRADASRIRFERVDYLSWRTDPFDVVVADTVLHLIPGDTNALVERLARDVRPGGVLVIAMPYACAYNRALSIARHALRAIRGRWSDTAILATGRLMHRDIDPDLLRERVHYMYRPPERVMDESLVRNLSARGLQVIATHPMTNTSLAQLKQNITVLRRDG